MNVNKTEDPLPEIGIAIVTWNNEKDIEECINSLLNQKTDRIYKIAIFDNDSQDKTKEIIGAKFLDSVTFFDSPENIYLTGGNNRLLDYFVNTLNVDKVMVLNPDTICSDTLIETLATTLDSKKKIGAVGPKVIFKNGIDDGLINSTGLIYDGFIQAYDRGFKEEDKGQYNKKETVFGVTGACIMFKSAMLKEIGFYDQNIKLYMDEVELFIRAKADGWKVIYNPETYIFHKYMGSVSQNTEYKREKEKMKTWRYIANKHYSTKSKLAMHKKYIQFLWNSKRRQQ